MVPFLHGPFGNVQWGNVYNCRQEPPISVRSAARAMSPPRIKTTPGNTPVNQYSQAFRGVQRVRLAIRISEPFSLGRSHVREGAPSSRERRCDPESGERSPPRFRHCEVRVGSHPAALVCNASASERGGYPADPGVSGSLKCRDDDGLSRDHVVTWNGTHVARTLSKTCGTRQPVLWTCGTQARSVTAPEAKKWREVQSASIPTPTPWA